jgi:hypothetical protein
LYGCATEVQRATSELAIRAFLFAMRSCEYLKVPEVEKKQTDIFRLQNIRMPLTAFQVRAHIWYHSTPQIPFLCLAISQPILGLISKIKVF